MSTRPTEVREPKQERSRRSFERVRTATLALLRERGPDAFTLAEVCARADASVGAIYHRVNGKDELLRLIHDQEMERIEAETKTVFTPAEDATTTLEEAVAQLVDNVSSVLRANADILRPFMLRAATDAVIAARGRSAHQLIKDLFITTLLQHSDEIRNTDHRRAAEWSYTIVYSIIARRLGLGSTIEGADTDYIADWDEVLADLTATAVAYLLLPLPGMRV